MADKQEEIKNLDNLSGFFLILGIVEGIVPFIAKLLDFTPVLVPASRLDAPIWWVVSASIIVISIVVILVIDQIKMKLEKKTLL